MSVLTMTVKRTERRQRKYFIDHGEGNLTPQVRGGGTGETDQTIPKHYHHQLCLFAAAEPDCSALSCHLPTQNPDHGHQQGRLARGAGVPHGKAVREGHISA